MSQTRYKRKLTTEECYKIDANRWKKMYLKLNKIKKDAMVVVPRIKSEIEKNGGKNIPKFITENLLDSHARIIKLNRDIKRIQSRLDKRVIDNHKHMLKHCPSEEEERKKRIQKSLNRFLALK